MADSPKCELLPSKPAPYSGAAVEKSAVERALCCPGGCLRDDDCYVVGNKFGRSKREREQADAVIALFNHSIPLPRDAERETRAKLAPGPWKIEPHRDNPYNCHVADANGHNVLTNCGRAFAEWLIEAERALPSIPSRGGVERETIEPVVPAVLIAALIGNIREYERYGSIDTKVANAICLYLNRALVAGSALPSIPSREGVERWRGAEEIPSVKPGNMDEFILAVHNPKTDKVHTFAAHYLNKYPVEMDDVPCADCDNSCEAGDGCPWTGWHTLVGDRRGDAGCFYKLELREGRSIAGWTEVPPYASPSPSPTPTSVMPDEGKQK